MAAELGQLTGLVDAITAITGGKTTTKRTTQTKISDQGINELIRGILAGPGGVASIGSATKRAGLYNSTTQDQALGDLYARAANQAELARSPTEITQTTQAPKVDLGTLGLTLAGTSLASSLFNNGLAGTGSAIANGIGSIFGSGSNAVSSALGSIFGSNSTGDGYGPTLAELGITNGTTAADGYGPTLEELGIKTGLSQLTGGLTNTANNALAGLGVNTSELSSLLPAGTLLPGIGGAVGGLLGGLKGATNPTSLLTTGGLGLLAGGPAGAAASVIASLFGGALKDSGIVSGAANVVGGAVKGVGKGVKSVAKGAGKAIHKIGKKLGF